MQKLVKIISSPFNPDLEVFDDMVIKLHVPYSEDNVTIQINPNIIEYKEKQDQPNIKVRQFSVTTPTDRTKYLEFDFKERNIHRVKIENKNYEIKLMAIGKEEIQGQKLPYFEFFISNL